MSLILNSKNTISLSSTNSMLLNVWRVSAAFFVLLGHSFSYYQITIFRDQSYFAYIQNIGVVIFFLISGFLIAHSFDVKKCGKTYRFSEFMLNRASRIGVAYIPALFFICLIDFLSIHINEVYSYYDALNIQTFLTNMFMLQDHPIFFVTRRIFGFSVTSFGSGRPLWALAVEYWIYLFWGYAILSIFNEKREYFPEWKNSFRIFFFDTLALWKSFPKVRLKPIQCFILLCLLIVPIFNVTIGRGRGLFWVWVVGFFLYHLHKKIVLSNRFSVASEILSLIILLAFLLHFKEAYCFPVYFALISIFLFQMLLGKNIVISKIKNNYAQIIAFFSAYTYSLYLVHYTIIDFIFHSNAFTLGPYNKFAIGIFISNLIAIIFYFCFERYGKRIEKYLHKRLYPAST